MSDQSTKSTKKLEIGKKELSNSEINEIKSRQSLALFNKSNYIASESFFQLFLIELANKYQMDPKKIVIENGFIYEQST